MRRPWLAVCGAVLCAMGCATRAPAPATLRVELLRGAPLPTQARPLRVEIVLDATASMRTRTPSGIEHFAAAHLAAQRLLRSLPEGTESSLFALGGPASTCEQPVVDPLGAQGVARAEQLHRLDGVRPRGEASFAQALRARALAREQGGSSRRIVGFTDLASDCAEAWCDLPPAFAARGVRLDLVVIGDAEVPACLTDPLQHTPVDPAHGLTSPEPVPFSVEFGAATGIPGMVRGVADGPAVTLGSGRGTLVVQLDPPFRINRQFPPGVDLVLQILDFPDMDPPVRRWRWVAASGTADEGPTNR